MGTAGNRARWLVYPAVAGFLLAGYAGLWGYRISRLGRQRHPRAALPVASRWCRRLWPLLRLRVTVDGALPAGPCLFVANHRSYLDIIVLLGALGTAFLSRADVRSWPLVGAVAEEIGCVFVQREDGRDRMRAARALLRALRQRALLVFPEGTTTGAPCPAPFEPGLFRLLQRCDVPVVPITVRYSDRRAYWVEDLSPWQHLRQRIFSGPVLIVALHVGAPLAPGEDAGHLAAATYEAVAAPIRTHGELCAL